jgi:hypothetical protein
MEGELNLALLAYRLFWGGIAAVLAIAVFLRVNCRLYNRRFVVPRENSGRTRSPSTSAGAESLESALRESTSRKAVANDSLLDTHDHSPSEDDSSNNARAANAGADGLPVIVVRDEPRYRRRPKHPAIPQAGVPIPSMGKSVLVALLIVLSIAVIAYATVLACDGLWEWVATLRPSQHSYRDYSNYGGQPPSARFDQVITASTIITAVFILAGLVGSVLVTAVILASTLHLPFGHAVRTAFIMLGMALLLIVLIVVFSSILGIYTFWSELQH